MPDPYKTGIEKFDEQLSFEPLKLFNVKRFEGFSPDGIVVSGMGGSGLPGKILQSFQNKVGISVPVVNRNSYGLPEHGFQKPFYVFLSHSGNTTEALSGFMETDNNSTCGVVTSDKKGVLGKLAEEKGLPLAVFPGGLTPRMSCGYMYYALVKILQSAFPNIKTENFSGRIKPEKLEGEGMSLAEKLFKKTVLVYTYPEQSHLAYIWKINLNETAKQLAFWGSFPEVTHNEAISLKDGNNKPAVLFLKTTAKRFDKENEKFERFKKFAEERGVDVFVVNVGNESSEENTWKNIILSHWTSFYLAELNKVDASDTEAMAKIKEADENFIA